MIAVAESSLPPTPPPPSLAFSMRMFGEASLRARTKSGFTGIAGVLEHGGTLEEALRGPGRRLPRFLRGVFIAARRSGSIEQVVGDYLAGFRRTGRARWSVIAAILYPAFLAMMTFLLAIAVFAVILPPFKFLFNDFGLELPFPTKVLMATSDLVVASWIWLVGGLGIVIAVLCLAMFSLRLPMASRTVRVLQSIPILGTASALAGASEFCMLLAMLVRARIPLPEALRLTAAGTRDSNLYAGALRLATEVERGETAAYAASILPNFGPLLIPLFRHTGRDETFAEILKSHAELFSLQAEAHAGIAVMWMQPLLLLLVGIMGAFVVVGVFLPVINLLQALV